MTETATLATNNIDIAHVLTKADADAFCGQFHETLTQLKDAIEIETACLRSMNIEQIGQLQDNKSVLSRTYARDIEAFNAQASEIGKLAPGNVDQLRKQHQLLRNAIVENEQILGVVKGVSETLIRRTAERVANANQPKTYTASASGPISPQAAAVACDRKL